MRKDIDFLYKYDICNVLTTENQGKMLSLKALKPSQREKKRYLAYEVEGLEKENMFSTQNLIVKKLNEMLGVYDSAIAGIQPLKFNKKNQGIIKINNKMVDKVRGCFVLIDEINKKPLRIRSIGLSGSMKQAKEKYLGIK